MGLVIVFTGFIGSLLNLFISGRQPQSLTLLIISILFAVFVTGLRLWKFKRISGVSAVAYLLLITGIMLLVPSGGAKNIQAEMKRTSALLAEGKTEKAIEILLVLKDEQPDNPMVTRELVTASIRNRRGANTEKMIDEAMNYMGWDETLWFDKGLLMLQLDNRKEALNSFNAAIELNPGYYEANLLAGTLCLEDENYRMAIYHLENARLCRRASPEVHYYLGRSFMELMQYMQAEKLFQQVLMLEPEGELAKAAKASIEYINAIQREG